MMTVEFMLKISPPKLILSGGKASEFRLRNKNILMSPENFLDICSWEPIPKRQSPRHQYSYFTTWVKSPDPSVCATKSAGPGCEKIRFNSNYLLPAMNTMSKFVNMF